ncbi:MAG TPA: ATP-binding protein [Patescibacteria group bacterium]|nr:ATP-binding protein [Patescibacteria group bacterium]
MKPTLYLMVGLPGSGKTTKAKEIEAEQNAIRLTPDDWIIERYGEDLNRKQRDEVRSPIEQEQWQAAKKELKAGRNVVLDFGLWGKAERVKFRKEAKGLGASVKIIFLDVDIEELWSRISSRPESQNGTLTITREELETWAKMFEPPTEEELS